MKLTDAANIRSAAQFELAKSRLVTSFSKEISCILYGGNIYNQASEKMLVCHISDTEWENSGFRATNNNLLR